MRKASSRWLIACLVLFGAMGSSASAAILSDFPGSPLGGTWVWQLDLAGDVLVNGDALIIQNDSGADWSLPGGWTTSQPNGWRFWRNPLIPAQNGPGVTQLVWVVNDASVAQGGIFSATPVGANDITGTWTLDGSAGSVIHVPQIPEAGTLSLLAVGLFAGALLKWRRKESD